ncbi:MULTISPECIES: sigma-70 family RNA polymerase sigma factor [Metasolibacillus]|uniref:sigma-70 family RNA polymerase sigma factor n=1 Tax=Metasolibacillus TaxID=2703677 RepID=UPI000D303CB3|nr:MULTISPECIES: sigma-70 family RNA polymerase sigma factor [Metasolibacillus]MCT6923505.1 sigma-70 family RNA polymerase sigma factor [Metasolibacillus sp.]MCT6939772.1 sigma-70 family RNA polymerase sigma factor [Metasolibacillus sp.]
MNFNQLATEYVDVLFRVAYTYVKNEQLAEDIVQDVFLKAFERQEQFRGEANYKTYLIKMTINRSHDMLRSWSYRHIVVSDVITNLFRFGKSAEDVVILANDNAELAKIILTLKPKYREVIFLYYYHDYDVNEIANLLQLSVNTIKTRLIRARNQLKNKTEVFRDE